MDASTELGVIMRTECFFLYISVLKVASGPRVKLVCCKSDLNPRKVKLLIVLRRWSVCVALWFILQGDLY